MFYALIHKPKVDTSKIDVLRSKYDPTSKLIDPHITLIFPTPEIVGKETLADHIQTVLKRWKPFEVHLQGLDKSWDHWLNLLVQEGNEQLVKLHDELYTGMMSPYLRKDLGYIPHIGLGLFSGKDYDLSNPKLVSLKEPEYQVVLGEAREANLDFRINLDQLELIQLDDELTGIIDSQVFKI